MCVCVCVGVCGYVCVCAWLHGYIIQVMRDFLLRVEGVGLQGAGLRKDLLREKARKYRPARLQGGG